MRIEIVPAKKKQSAKSNASPKKEVIRVIELATGKVVHVVDVTGKSSSAIERVERGMLINMNTDRFCVETPDVQK